MGIRADARLDLYPFRRHRKSPISLSAHFETSLDEPDFYVQHMYANHYKWENDFGKISTTKIEGKLAIPHLDFELAAGYALLDKNIYYDTLGVVRQNTTPMSVAKVSLTKNFRLWKFHFDNRILAQVSSNEDVMPLPLVAANLRWYLQFDIVSKDVMQMQIGANVTGTTKWYAPAYSPALGQFHNQKKEQYGMSPYIDAFINVQWKRATIFVKLVNAGMGWPLESADYFSAHGFIRPQRALKFGIWCRSISSHTGTRAPATAPDPAAALPPVTAVRVPEAASATFATGSAASVEAWAAPTASNPTRHVLPAVLPIPGPFHRGASRSRFPAAGTAGAYAAGGDGIRPLRPRPQGLDLPHHDVQRRIQL